MNKNMKIQVFGGLADDVYKYIGHFAMDSKFVKQNGNSITTSKSHVWHVGFEGRKMVCFCSVKIANSSKNMQIGNLFVLDGEQHTFDILVQSVVNSKKKESILMAYANNETKDWFAELGFEMSRKGTNWHNMKYNDSL